MLAFQHAMCRICHARPRCLKQILGVAWILSCLIGATRAQATVVSRLGAIYLYDPLTFDAGVLQRGGYIRLAAASDRSWLDAGVDLPFFRELSLRAGVEQLSTSVDDPSLNLVWRVRLPIVERARYGNLSSLQLGAIIRTPFAPLDPLTPQRELFVASSGAWLASHRAYSLHWQAGMVSRDLQQAAEDLSLSQFGVMSRLSWLYQLYLPPRGMGGKWTVTLAFVEAQWVHFGVSLQRPGDGLLTLSSGNPTVHFSHSRTTWSLGLAPQLRVRYDEAGNVPGLGLLLGASCTYRTFLE